MLNKKEWQLPVAFVCLCLGFLLAIQLHTQSTIKKDILPYSRNSGLMELLVRTEKEKQALTEEITPLRNLAGNSPDRNSLKRELQRLQILAGITEVKGPGIVLTLSDSTREARPNEDPEFLIIHDYDLLRTVNELWACGAEAVELNGQRIVNSSAIRCAGPTILVNSTKVGPPYVIKAIGNRDDLLQVDMRGGVLDYLRAFGIKAEIAEDDSLALAPYNGSITANYAKPTTGGAQ